MKSFDFDFSQKNSNKAFLSKLQAERQQRLSSKKAQTSASFILSYYRQTRAYALKTHSISIDFLNKTRDLKKLEPVLKENYPLILQKALEKYQLFRVCLLFTYRNGEKYLELINNLCYFQSILSQKGLSCFASHSKANDVYMKRLILGLTGVISRGNPSKELQFFLTNNKEIYDNLEIDDKVVMKLLKTRIFEKNLEFWVPVLKKFVKPWVLKERPERRVVLREILMIKKGVSLFLRRKTAGMGFKALVEEAKGILMKNHYKDKDETARILLENMNQLLMKDPIFSQKTHELQQNFIDFIDVFTSILEFLLGKSQNSFMEEEKTMEIEQFSQLDPNFDFSVFFSSNFLELVSTIFTEELRKNTPILRLADLKAIQRISRAFSLIFSVKSQEKTKYLLAMSQTPSFLLKMFDIVEFFASFSDLKKPNLELFSDILALFSRIYLQKIELMDHAEFFSLNLENFANKPSFIRNFPMEKVEFLSQFLINFAYHAFFVENQSLDCKSIIFKLLNSLYFRHCQRNFNNNPKFWQISQANELSQHNTQIFSQLPFIFPFETRLLRLKELIKEDQSQYKRDDFLDLESISIRRGFELDDAVAEVLMKKIQWKDRLRVKYISSQGIEEIGIDGGGMFKEFLTVIARKACDLNFGLFIETDNHCLRPNKDSRVLLNGRDVEMFEFIGKMVGKAVYEGILIEGVFERTFLKGVIGQKCEFNDLAGLEKEVYKSLLVLKHCDREEEIREMEMFFCVSEEGVEGAKNVELKNGGEKIRVDM